MLGVLSKSSLLSYSSWLRNNWRFTFSKIHLAIKCKRIPLSGANDLVEDICKWCMLVIFDINLFIVENDFSCVQKLQKSFGGSRYFSSMLIQVKVVHDEGMCGKAVWYRGDFKLRNLLCGSRKECVFEGVIISLLGILYENFALWAKILFLPKINTEVEYSMECVLSFWFGWCWVSLIFFLRKVWFMSFICNHRHKNTW